MILILIPLIAKKRKAATNNSCSITLAMHKMLCFIEVQQAINLHFPVLMSHVTLLPALRIIYDQLYIK